MCVFKCCWSTDADESYDDQQVLNSLQCSVHLTSYLLTLSPHGTGPTLEPALTLLHICYQGTCSVNDAGAPVAPDEALGLLPSAAKLQHAVQPLGAVLHTQLGTAPLQGSATGTSGPPGFTAHELAVVPQLARYTSPVHGDCLARLLQTMA